MKVRPHLKAEDWPKEATDYMAELVKERRCARRRLRE